MTPGRRRMLALALAVFLLLPGLLSAQDALETFLDTRVAAVRIRPQAAEVPPDLEPRLLERIPLKPGSLLTREDLRDSLQVLYATLHFAQIEAGAVSTPQGVEITFYTHPNYFIQAVQVEGAPGPPTAVQLVNATKLELGRLFRQDAVAAAVANIQAVMRDNGFYQAQVTPSITYDHADLLVNLLFRVARGPRARVGAVTASGDAGFSLLQLQDIAGLHPGDPVSASRLARAQRRLRKRLEKDRRLEAQVSVMPGAYDPARDSVDYRIEIRRGPRVNVAVAGARLRRGLVKRYVPIFEEFTVDEDLLQEGRRNIRDHFQSQGYFDATVEVSLRSDPVQDREDILYSVDRGQRHRLRQVTITGNRYFDRETIRERMQVTPASLLLFYGRFSQSLLNRDLQAIEALYRSNGFLQVKVAGVAETSGQDKDDLLTRITIEEGPQSRIVALSIEGARAIPEAVIRDHMATREDEPYSEATLLDDRETILNLYYDRGFPEARFEVSAEPVSGQAARFHVRVRITEGRQTFVRKVILAGLEHTRPYVVGRELRVKAGDPLSPTALLDTQRRLYDLGIFNAVDVAIQNPTGSLDQKNVMVRVEEAKRYTFNYGVGLEVQTGSVPGCSSGGNCQPQGRTGVSPRVSFDMTRLNFLGRNHTLGFKARVGRLQQRALVSYEAPYWWDHPDLKFTLIAFYEKKQDVRTFTAERMEASTQVQQSVSKSTTFLYRFTYRRVTVDQSTLQVDPNLIPLLSRPVRVGFPSFTYIRDTRDDPTDTRRGSFTTSDFSLAANAFGSESSFARLFFQNSTYLPFHRKRWVFARTTQVGFEVPFGSVANSFVPLPEKFFAGGGNSHRGFAINQAGPRDLTTGFPLGGESLFLNTVELRSPPIALPLIGENLSATIFHDMGNVFPKAGDLFEGLKRFSQKAPDQCRIAGLCDFRYLSHAVGVGVRYRTPIGPVRIDLGYNLTPTAFPIQNQSRSEQLRRFNIFFSIGQSF
jgi:outer membrane protein insertion porin family